MTAARTEQATALMSQFAERTGLIGERPQQRYLWTDAFAVCNFLALGREDLARRLIDRVHHVLGRHRDDDARIGWLDGAHEQHPTRGGLRIGKPLPERGPREPLSEQLEWERDGQYFHYLTKWMHALDVAGHRDWATELAIVAHLRFTYATRSGRRMYWKLSIDLSRPLVATMGHHDPLDGFITGVQLGDGIPHDLLADYAAMIEPHRLATPDPLGIGGLLVDAFRVHQLVEQRRWPSFDLLDPLLEGALIGLHRVVLEGSADRRLGFRELGLAIGLAAVARVPRAAGRFARYAALRDEIVGFWLDPAHRSTRTWSEHANINDVMLATALVPDGFLVVPAVNPSRESPRRHRRAS